MKISQLSTLFPLVPSTDNLYKLFGAQICPFWSESLLFDILMVLTIPEWFFFKNQSWKINYIYLACKELKRAISDFAFVVFYKDFQYFIHSFKSDFLYEKTWFSAYIRSYQVLLLYVPSQRAMVMARRSVHLTTLISLASLNKRLTSTSCTYFRL